MPGTFAYTVATNIVVVTGGTSGSPADFASFVAADRAGTGTVLLAAWSPNSNTKTLTYQVRPVELLALIIDFVVAAKTAEADYIFITGTDAWDAVQTESIDVTAGNGTYTTTKLFKTITNIDCSDNAAGGGTVWANGTVAVSQRIWGVIWDKGNGQYQIDSHFRVGNGSTYTYFVTQKEQIRFALDCSLQSESNSTIRSGVEVEANQISKGSTISFDHTGDTFYFYGEVYLYDSRWQQTRTNGIGLKFYGGAIKFFVFSGLFAVFYYSPTMVIDNVTAINGSQGFTLLTIFNTAPKSCKTVYCEIGFQGEVNNSIFLDAVCLASKYQDIRTWTYGPFTVINPQFTPTQSKLENGNGGGPIFYDITFDLKVSDKDDTPIEGATVTLKDKDGNTIFNVDTLVTGKIASQQIHVKSWTGEDETETIFTPHTLTITKDGYQDYQGVITIDRKMDLEVAMGLPGGGVARLNRGWDLYNWELR